MSTAEDDSRAGFTLVEAAGATALLGIVAVGWLAAVTAQISVLSRASERVTASALAEDRLNAVRLWLPEADGRLPDSLQSGRFDMPLDAYHWEAQVRPSTLDLPLTDVRVIVRWPGGREILHTRFRTASLHSIRSGTSR